ncbi:hypothetical protein FHR62_000039 [Xanthomonas arboricola]|nr:hypothetical protein [Xanthomonas arboricola]
MRRGCPGGYRSSDDSHFRLAAASSVTTSFNRSICMNLRMACAGLVCMQGRSVARRRIRCRDAPSIRPWRLGGGIHAATRSRPRTRHHAPSMPSAFLSVTDSNWWCLRGCRRGTLSGMDAAPEPTRTYLRRVPHRHACKRPQQTEAFAQSRQTSCARLFCVGTRASVCSNPMHSYKTRRCRPQDRWRGAVSSDGRRTGARSKSTALQESWNTKHQNGQQITLPAVRFASSSE